jgi:thiamine pyrophosphate-dependent acetolactate synthase large subunit-like protein
MAEITGGEAVVRTLIAHGVDVVFGLIGVHALPIYDALFKHPELRHISVRHEQSAAYLADGYSRASGRPGVCVTTTGPGAANTAAAMGTAYSDSVPILNITTQIPSDLVDKGRGFLHEAKDQLGLFRALTKWNARVDRIQDIPSVIHEAFLAMAEGRPRPTHVEFCADVLAATADEQAISWVSGSLPENRPGDDRNKIAEAARMIAASQAPVIWAGGGVIRSGAAEELVRLAETLQAPVVTTVQGNGAIPYDHPLAVGYRPAQAAVSSLLAKSDLLLAVGTRFPAMQTLTWTLALPKRLIHVDIDEGEIGKNYPAALGLVGDAKAVLRQLLDSVPSLSRASCWAGSVSDIRAKIAAEMKSNALAEMGLLEVIRGSIDRDAIVVCDQTKPAYWASGAFPVFAPRTFLYPGYGTLGFGFPAALGAKIAAPDRQVICLCGDGGFQYALPELATAAQFGVNVTVLLFNDSAYGILKDMQDGAYGGRHYAVALVNPDFPRLVESYGLRCESLDGQEGLEGALKDALAADRTTVVEIDTSVARPPQGVH